MAYGTIKVDNITFDNGGVDKLITVSGLFYSTSGALTVTGTISGGNVTAPTATFTTLTGTTTTGTTATFTSGSFTTLTGTTVTGTTANFVSGVFTTQVSGTTITGTTVATTTGSFVSLTGTTATFTSGIIASGTAALPSLAILSDPNTGIYSPGADQLAISTSGVGRLFVNSNGDIGLGTSSPDVFGRFYTRAIGLSSSGSTSLQINAATGSNAVIDLGVNSARTAGITSNVSETAFSTLTATPIILSTNGSERLRITSAGLVGVGTSAPADSLQVRPVVLANPNSSGSEATGSSFGIGGNIHFQERQPNGAFSDRSDLAIVTNTGFGIGESEKIRITAGGLVGVGTTSPSSALHVVGTTTLNGTQSFTANSTTGSYATFQHNGTIVGDIGTANQAISSGSNTDFAISTRAATSIVFGINTAEKARLDSSGRLGIGTSSPGYLLDVAGNARIGNAPAATNVILNINGVVSKASRIAFQESGVDKWLIGNGAASENGNFEIYDAVNGNILLSDAMKKQLLDELNLNVDNGIEKKRLLGGHTLSGGFCDEVVHLAVWQVKVESDYTNSMLYTQGTDKNSQLKIYPISEFDKELSRIADAKTSLAWLLHKNA